MDQMFDHNIVDSRQFPPELENCEEKEQNSARHQNDDESRNEKALEESSGGGGGGSSTLQVAVCDKTSFPKHSQQNDENVVPDDNNNNNDNNKNKNRFSRTACDKTQQTQADENEQNLSNILKENEEPQEFAENDVEKKVSCENNENCDWFCHKNEAANEATITEHNSLNCCNLFDVQRM